MLKTKISFNHNKMVWPPKEKKKLNEVNLYKKMTLERKLQLKFTLCCCYLHF